jgi:Ca2+-binding RTX toxin-like protein
MGDAGADTLISGTSTRLNYFGGSGNDSIQVTSASQVEGNDGEDTISVSGYFRRPFQYDAGAGNDSVWADSINYLTIVGGNGNDTLAVGNSTDVIANGGDGDDSLAGGAGVSSTFALEWRSWQRHDNPWRCE